MDSKRRSFKTVSYEDLLVININENLFFGSKMGQTNKCKLLRVRYFLRFFARNCSLHLEHIKKINKYKK